MIEIFAVSPTRKVRHAIAGSSRKKLHTRLEIDEKWVQSAMAAETLSTRRTNVPLEQVYLVVPATKCEQRLKRSNNQLAVNPLHESSLGNATNSSEQSANKKDLWDESS